MIASLIRSATLFSFCSHKSRPFGEAFSQGWHGLASIFRRLNFQETNMQRDIQIRIVDRWALASDGGQWVVQKQAGDSWVALKFIRSTKDTLEWSMGRAGVPCHIREQLIEGLPETFDEWRELACLPPRSLKAA
jgi:hypothetical protein